MKKTERENKDNGLKKRDNGFEKKKKGIKYKTIIHMGKKIWIKQT